MARQKQQGKSRKPSQSARVGTQEAVMTETFESQGSFADALNATQQHTVPILPAYDAPRPHQAEAQPLESPSTATRAPASPRMSYARATLAPSIGGMHRTNSHSGASTPSSDASTYQTPAQQPTGRRAAASPVRDTTAGETAKSSIRDDFSDRSWSVGGVEVKRGFAGRRHSDALPTTSDMAMADIAEQNDADLALTPGRPTFALPAITADSLPAIRPPLTERQLAVREAEEPAAVFIRGASKLPAPNFALAPRRHGPRPFIVQFLVAMVTVMTLFAVLTLASPLGKGLAFSYGFQAYANAMPWIPTPTPTPKPTPAPTFYGQQRGVNPGQQVIVNTINAVFGQYASGALNIARCESGYDPNAYNSYPVAGSHAEGVFQILYPSTWSGTSYARYSPYDYNANIHAAYEIFHNDGNSWREWECRP